MAEPRARKAPGSWQWKRRPETRRTLLDAACAVFSILGFAATSITDIVEQAGSSNGSLYHHFDGKRDLFLALWEEHQKALEDTASRAVAEAGLAGASDPAALFAAGARAYLKCCWQRRNRTMLFSAGDGPPDFEVMKRQRAHMWIWQNAGLWLLPDRPPDRLYAAVLTSLISDGAREVAATSTEAQAVHIIEAVIEYSHRIMVGGPACVPDAPSIPGKDNAEPDLL
jgi:AcrR family transcriptional regulator